MELDAILTKICTKNQFADTRLGQILQDVEFWEGGSVQVENGTLRIWGDNGVKDIETIDELNLIIAAFKEMDGDEFLADFKEVLLTEVLV